MKCVKKIMLTVSALLAAGSLVLGADLNEVQNKIQKDTNINQLQVRTEDGKVILEGVASSLKDKYKAEKIAKKEMKSDVVNNIAITGGNKTDEDIGVDVVAKIRQESTSYGNNVFDSLNVLVKDGGVTLTGKVRNAYLYDVAEEAAMEVPGVRKVDNKIEILPPSQNDDRLRLAIYRRLKNDDRLFYYFLGARPSLNIIVDRGRVTLTGYVDTEGDRILAGSLVRQMSGVLSVENQLKTD
ncbi:BON domain-containing protein [bacterium]|nr:BON domain-containing protein [bacterium]